MMMMMITATIDDYSLLVSSATAAVSPIYSNDVDVDRKMHR